MFSGGGASYAEAQLKAGHIGIDPNREPVRPERSLLPLVADQITARRDSLAARRPCARTRRRHPSVRLRLEIIRITEARRAVARPVPSRAAVR